MARPTNGLALCTLHHKLFDVGTFTLNPELLVTVSSMANGNEGSQRWLLDFHGEPISPPSLPKLQPEGNFLKWHVRGVFKGEGQHELDLG